MSALVKTSPALNVQKNVEISKLKARCYLKLGEWQLNLAAQRDEKSATREVKHSGSFEHNDLDDWKLGSGDGGEYSFDYVCVVKISSLCLFVGGRLVTTLTFV